MNRNIIVGIILALILSIGLFGRALAHAKLVSSDPAAGARLTKAPAKVTLVFSEEISAKETESNFTVTDEQGTMVGTGKLDTNDLDRKTLSGALKAGLGDGVYTVKWATVTPDDNGHSEGSFTFGVNKDPGPQPGAEHSHEEQTPTAAAGPAQPTTAPTARPTAAAGAAAQPTATATGPTTLPKTGESGPGLGGYILFGTLVLLASGMALRRVSAGTRD